jgi:hypothetical protein
VEVESGATPGLWTVGTGAIRPFPKGSGIDLRNNLKSLEVLSHINVEENKGLGGAASGAVLGFLLAGPLGTVVGAAAGRGASKKDGKEEFRVRLTTVSGKSIVARVKPTELEELNRLLEETNSSKNDPSALIAERLKTLESLHSAKIISDDEFKSARMNIISG